MAQDLHIERVAIFQSFLAWGKYSILYKNTFKKVSKDLLSIAEIAFNEMNIINTIGYELWWALNHAKYQRKPGVQYQITLLHELIFAFLAVYRVGQVGKIIEEGKKKEKEGRGRRQKISEENQAFS